MEQNNDYDGVRILDCSIRDGGHLNKWNFSKDFVKKYFNAIKDSGVDYIELGYRSTPGSVPGAGEFRYTSDELISEIVGKNNLEAKISVMVDIGKITSDDFAPKQESPVDLVRVAFYRDGVDEGLELVEDLIAKGYETGVNLMGAVQYSPEDLEETLTKIKSSKTGVVYLADSFGSLEPEKVGELTRLMKTLTGKVVGFHAHNNIQLALANTDAAVNAGAGYVDVTINGMGRGAGNLQTELLLSRLNQKRLGNYDLGNLLDFINTDLEEIKNQVSWGYMLPYAITGVKGVHPTYAKDLLDKGYRMSETNSLLGKLDTSTPGFKSSEFDRADLSNEKVTVLLPCHKGSQRVENKNTRPFAGSSLTQIKLEQLLNTPEVNEVLVFTDDPIVTDVCHSLNDGRLKVKEESRPNVANNDQLIAHFANQLNGEEGHILWTHVTSPFINEQTYSKAINQYLQNRDRFDSMVSVNELKEYIWDENKRPFSYDVKKEGFWPKTQNIPSLYKINSGIFLLPSGVMKRSKNRIGTKVQYFKCSEIEGLDIDWLPDFERAELLWKTLKAQEASN